MTVPGCCPICNSPVASQIDQANNLCKDHAKKGNGKNKGVHDEAETEDAKKM